MKIAFLGDSITFGYGLADTAARYATRVCRALGATEANYGICGTLIANAGVSEDNGQSFLARWQLLADADRAVIFGGTNDYFWSNYPLEAPAGAETDTHYFRPALCSLLDAVRTLYPPEKLLIVTPYSHHGVGNYAGGASWNDANEHDTTALNYLGHSLGDYAEAIYHEAVKRSLPCLHLHTRPFDWKSLTSDGCHPNPAGHQWLAEQLLPYFN